MDRTITTRMTLAILVSVVLSSSTVLASDTWPRRFGDVRNTANAGDEPALTPTSVRDLVTIRNVQVGGNGTPIVGHGLVFYGGDAIYVFDETTGKTLVRAPQSSLLPIETTGTLATVTVPGEGGVEREETRFYIGENSATTTLHCLNVDAILADKDTLDANDGSAYVCDGPERPFEITASTGILTAATNVPNLGEPRKPWPLSLEPPPPGLGPGLGMVLQTFDGTPLFSRDQPIEVNGEIGIRDVLFAPSMGTEPSCSNGVVWAIDAYTGEKLWQWDPVSAGAGGLVWFSPAMSGDKQHLYVTTGDCVDKPHLGEMSESTVSLDPATGEVQWYYQARLVDTRDYDIGNSPSVVDVDDAGCHVVVNPNKDGCFYAFSQDADIPEVGEEGYDPLRVGQQRLLWRTCLAQSGTSQGGFNATGVAVHDRWVMAQSGRPGTVNAFGFIVDACDEGKLVKATSDLAAGLSDGAVASGMWFIANHSNNRLSVIRTEPPFELLATVELPNSSAGGGGPAIANGRIYVPAAGLVTVGVGLPGNDASAPQFGPELDYDGPWDQPLGTRDDVNVFGPTWPASDVWDEATQGSGPWNQAPLPLDDAARAIQEVSPETEAEILALLASLEAAQARSPERSLLSPEARSRFEVLVEAGYPEKDAIVALLHEARREELFAGLARIPGGAEAFNVIRYRDYYDAPDGDEKPPLSFSDLRDDP